MKRIRIAVVFLSPAAIFLAMNVLVHASAPSTSTTIAIQPSDAASLYAWTCCEMSVSHYADAMIIVGEVQGIARFPTSAIAGPVTQATLTISPYGIPLDDYSLDVYGIASGDGTATLADANIGEYLGSFALPSSGWFSDAPFDVTSFVSRSHVPFIGFNFRSDKGGGDTMYPPILHVTFVPEPATIALLLIGMAGVTCRRCR